MLRDFHSLLSLVIAWNVAWRPAKKKKQEESKMNHRAESKSHQHHPPQMTHDTTKNERQRKHKNLLLLLSSAASSSSSLCSRQPTNFKFHSRFRYRPREVTFTWPPGHDMSSTQLNSKHLQKRLAHRKIDNQIFINFFCFFSSSFFAFFCSWGFAAGFAVIAVQPAESLNAYTCVNVHFALCVAPRGSPCTTCSLFT